MRCWRASSRGCFACCRSWAGAAEDGAAVEEHERYRVARGVCSLLERCAAEQPLVVVLEDLHWSDAATLELLPWLARRVRDCAVLVLATLRSDELARAPDVLATVAELERQRLGERIALAPLEPDAVEEMVRAIAADASPALLDAVRRRSDGNPLFVEELVRTLGGGSDEVPPTIQEAIVRRVARLPADAQALLSVASVVGERFELEPVRRIAGLDEAAALAAVRAALELELVSRGAPGRLPVPSRADARRGVRAAARARAPRVARARGRDARRGGRGARGRGGVSLRGGRRRRARA